MIRCERRQLPSGVALSLRCSGPASEHAQQRLMCLHGFPEAAFIWDDLLMQLGPTTHGVAPNLRGFELSDSPLEVDRYHPKWLCQDVVLLIESLGAPLDLLVAHDWGGALAWSVAAQRPDLLKHLLIINAPHPATFLRELRDNPNQQQASAYMNFLCRPDAQQLLRQDDFARLWRFFDDEQGCAGWLDEGLKQRYRAVWERGLEGGLNYYRATALRPDAGDSGVLRRLKLPDALTRVRVPTTVLWGMRDRALLPELIRGLEDWVPDLRVRPQPDAGHWIVHEQPHRLFELVQEVLAVSP